MINVIVPIIEKPEQFSQFVASLPEKGCKVFVGIKEKLAQAFSVKSKNVSVRIFANNAKREEIINALHDSKFSNGKILIVRRPLQKEEIDQLLHSDKDIAVLKQKHNSFVTKFKNMMAGLIRKIFGFSFFDDISAVCFGQSMFELLSVCPNLSMASRINRFIGVEIEEFETASKGVKKEQNFKKNLFKFLGYTLFWLLSITAVVLLSIFTKVIIVAVMFEILWLIVASTLWVIALLNFSRALTVGDLHFGKAEEKDI